MVRFLLEEYKGTQLILALSTSIVGDWNKRVIVRNETVKKIAEKYHLPIIDLYAASVKYFSLISEDGIHFTEAGYQKLAEKFLAEVSSFL